MILFCLPFVLIGTVEARAQPGQAVPRRVRMMLGGVLLRINGFLIGYDTGRAGATSRRCPNCSSQSA